MAIAFIRAPYGAQPPRSFPDRHVMKSVIVYGPPACGKTRHAEELRAGFKLDKIVDSWDGQHRDNIGVLYLTNTVPARFVGGRRVFSFKEALAYVRKAK